MQEDNSHADDDGVIDNQEQKEIDRSHQKALESRHRGKMQVRFLSLPLFVRHGKLTGEMGMRSISRLGRRCGPRMGSRTD